MLTHVDLFSGIGGFALAARRTGFKTVAFCERDKWCQRVLAKNFGAVVADGNGNVVTQQKRSGAEERRRSSNGGEAIATADTNGQRRKGSRRGKSGESNGEETRRRWSSDGSVPIIPDIRNFPSRAYTGATLLTAGFPCQPFSQAGKRKGAKDDRALWPALFRVIQDARPCWLVLENVPGLLSMVEYADDAPVDSEGYALAAEGDLYSHVGRGYAETLLASLEAVGYEVQAVVIPACAVDAPHRRDRVWIVGHANGSLCERGTDEPERGSEGRTPAGGTSKALGLAPGARCERSKIGSVRDQKGEPGPATGSQAVGHAEERTERPGLREGDSGRIGRGRPGDAGGEDASDADCTRRIEQLWSITNTAEYPPPQRGGGREPQSDLGLLAHELPTGLARWSPEPEGVPRVATGVADRVNKLRGLGNAIVPAVAEELMRMIAAVEMQA